MTPPLNVAARDSQPSTMPVITRVITSATRTGSSIE